MWPLVESSLSSLFEASAKTNSHGVAVVRGLPAGVNYFDVDHDDYELPIGETNRRHGHVDLVAGEQ